MKDHPRVFVPQVPSKFDPPTKLWIPTMNLDPAKKHGDIVIMLPPNANRLHTSPLIQVLKERMIDYTEDDFIVAVGDPSLLAAAACIASRKTGGLVRMLKWDRITSDYILVEFKI